MRTPTQEQRDVLESDARIRLVRAAPGSGKTWLVAEVIREALKTWPRNTCGIAALSFTRVGGDEIRKAVGHDLGHPHFVGTIDAFLFRYVVRPHLRKAFSWFAEPRLIVGEWGAEHWGKCGANRTASVGKGINLFGCVWIGEEQGKEIIAHKPHPRQPLHTLAAPDANQVRTAKKLMWEQRGFLTHSDAALWANRILAHPTFGSIVRAEVIRRFPFLIVDELQDTGHFLGKSIRLLLGEPTARGLLVGDPDQAIFEFTGARPALFNTFEGLAGATSMPLASSRRSPAAVAKAASHVKDSGGMFSPAHDKTGRAVLVRYSDLTADVPKVVAAASASRPTGVLKVIARRTTTIEDLVGRRVEDSPSLHCPPLTHMHRAVVAFRRNKNGAALAAARAALERAVFDHEGVKDEELTAVKIEPRDWKSLAIRCLLKVNSITATGTYYYWQVQAGEALDGEIVAFELESILNFVPGKLKPQKRPGWDKPDAQYLPQPNAAAQPLLGIPVHTVHGVKGETHDLTVFACPPTNKAHCPSHVWWSTNDKDREERRIAYVAMTRTQGDLVMCVSDACYQRLAARRPQFVASFECMTVAEYVTSLGQATVTDHMA